MYYDINVAKMSNRPYENRYEHFFATAERSVTTESKMKEVLKTLLLAFPEPMYNITVTLWETIGHGIDIEKIINERSDEK